MRVLNSTTALQSLAEGEGISRYDAVLIVAQRAKEKAYESAEEQTGYLGSSFGGSSFGTAMRKPKPAQSEVIGAIEELLTDVQDNGEFPQLITPGTPEELQELEELEDLTAAASGLETTPKAVEEPVKETAEGIVEPIEEETAVDDNFDDDLDMLLMDGDEKLADLFGNAFGVGEENIEASGMSPGDAG